MELLTTIYEYLIWYKMSSAYICIAAFVAHYMAASIIMEIYGEKISRLRKVLFALLGGVLLHNVVFFAASEFHIVESVAYVFNLFSLPNPIWAMLYYFIGCKILKLQYARAIRLMNHAYMYLFICAAIKSIVIDCEFLVMGGLVPLESLNTLIIYAVMSLLYVLVSKIILLFVRKVDYNIDFRDSMFVKSIPAEAVRSLIWLSAGWGMTLYFMSLKLRASLAFTLFYFVTVAALFALNLMWDTNRVARARLQNKNVYISTLAKSVDDFRGFKHDINNVLQTYSGYLEIGDLPSLKNYHKAVTQTALSAQAQLELANRMEECPAIVALLMEKLDYAERCEVDLKISIMGQIVVPDRMLIDLSRCLACLLDNAIEAAAESERKMVFFSREVKANANNLIVITNSTKGEIDPTECFQSGYTTKENHTGAGLVNVRKIVDKHSDWTLNITHYNNEFSVFIEMLNAV